MRRLTIILVILMFVFSPLPVNSHEDHDHEDNSSLDDPSINDDLNRDARTDIKEDIRDSDTRIKRRLRQTDSGLKIREEIRDKDSKRKFILKEVRDRIDESDLRRVDQLVTNNDKVKEFLKGLSKDDVEKFLRFDRARQKKIFKMGKEKAEKDLKRFKFKKEIKFKEREIPREIKIKHKKEFNEAKIKYREKIKSVRERKQQLQDAIKLKDNEKILGHGKIYLTQITDSLINAFIRIKAKIESSENLNETQAAEMISDIKSKIAELEEIKINIESSTSLEELRRIKTDLRSTWKELRIRLKNHKNKILHARLGEIIKRSSSLERKIDKALARAEENNIDVSDLEPRIQEFSDNVEEARTKFEDARELFLSSENSEKVQEANSLIKEAIDTLKEAKKILDELRDEIKSRADINIEDEDEDGELVEEDLENGEKVVEEVNETA